MSFYKKCRTTISSPLCYSNICNSVAEVYLPKFVCSSANILKVWVGGHISATRLRYFLAPFNAISLRVPLPVPRRRSFLFGALYSLLWARSTLSIVFPKATNLTVPRLPKRPIGPEPFQVYVMAGIRGIEPRSLDRQSSVLTDKRYAQIFIIDFYYLYIIIYFL